MSILAASVLPFLISHTGKRSFSGAGTQMLLPGVRFMPNSRDRTVGLHMTIMLSIPPVRQIELAVGVRGAIKTGGSV